MFKHLKNLNSQGGFWAMVVAALLLEGTVAFQYFYSQKAIKQVAVERAHTELKKAELEIEKHTIEMEAAARVLAKMVEKHLNNPDSVFEATRFVVANIKNTSSLAVAYVPGYFPKYGRFFEACSSQITADSIYTRQIGSAEHDYTQLEWFQNGLNIDSCWWCEPYLDDSGSKTWVVSCSYPIRNGKGEKVAVVCVDWTLDTMQELADKLQVYRESDCAIFSQTRIAIIPPDTIAGAAYNFFDKEIGATGWHVQLRIPEAVLFEDLRRNSLTISLLMLLGLAVLGFILYRSARTTQTLIKTAAENERMEGELEVAQTIQMAMLPKVFPPFADRLDLNVYGRVTPAKEVGGDLYDFYVRSEKLFFCVGDVSGKGVPAALIMATTRSLFRSVTAHEEEAAEIVAEMNNAISEANEQNMFITLFLGVLELKTGRLEYCNAGHNAPVILRNDGSKGQMLEVLPNIPIGIMADYAFKAQETTMAYNDLLFLYTDGLTEAENIAHAQFGEERMMASIEQLRSMQPRFMVDAMQADVVKFAGQAPQSDDLTMLAIRYQQPALFMRNDIQQIPTLAEWIEWLNIPMELSMAVNLALEEIVANVMLYAYPNNRNGRVLVESWRSAGKIHFAITDSGIEFDPTEHAEADTTLSAEEREIGGLGIHLVRQLMDEIAYHRVDGHNILILEKALENTNPSEKVNQ